MNLPRLTMMQTSSSVPTTLESRVLVSARRLRDLKAAPADIEIEAIEPVERTARAVQAPELALANSREEDANDNALKAHP